MLVGDHGAGLVALIGCLFSPFEMQGYLEFLLATRPPPLRTCIAAVLLLVC